MKSHASMNRVYRLIWSADSGTWVPVSELANGRGKSSGLRGVLRKSSRLAAFCVAGALACPAFGMSPDLAQVVSGGVTIDQSLLNQTQINQSTQKAIVNWNSFSIGADHSVQFNLPNQSAISLNRVIGDQASSILGSLSSNGQVWLLNPNGVLIGAGGTVNAQGFLASTRALSDESFLLQDRFYQFSGASGASVTNNGVITANGSGYAVLSGQTVQNQNQGLVQARLGKVVLAGAESFTVDVMGDRLLSFQVATGTPVEQLGQLLSVENQGSLLADGGHVLLSAQSVSNVVQGVVNVGGLTQANTVAFEEGGMVLGYDKSGYVEINGGELSTVNLTGQIDVKASANINSFGGYINATGAHINVDSTAVLDIGGQFNGGGVGLQAGNNWWMTEGVVSSTNVLTAPQYSIKISSPNLNVDYISLNTPGTIELDVDINVGYGFDANGGSLLLHGDVRNINALNSEYGYVNLGIQVDSFDSAQSTALNINTGDQYGSVYFGRAVGAINPLRSLNVNAPYVYLQADVNVLDSFDVRADYINLYSQESKIKTVNGRVHLDAAVTSDFYYGNESVIARTPLSIVANDVLIGATSSTLDSMSSGTSVLGNLSINNNLGGAAVALNSVTVVGSFDVDVAGSLSIESVGDLQLNGVKATGNIDLKSKPSLNQSSPMPMQEVFLSELSVPVAGDIVLNGVVESTTGDITVSSANNLISNVAEGIAPLKVSANNRYLVYTNSAEQNFAQGLTFDFRQYGVSGVSEVDERGQGNGALYSEAYSVSLVADQSFSKQYDGSATVTPESLVSLKITDLENEYSVDLIASDTALFRDINADTLTLFDSSQFSVDSFFDVVNQQTVYGASFDPFVEPTSIVGTIDKKQLTASINGSVSKIYDGTTNVLGLDSLVLLSGFAPNEQIFLGAASGEYSTKNAGSGIGVNVDLAVATYMAGQGTLLSNYALPTTVLSSNDGQIFQRALKVSYTGVNKTYDATTTAQVNSIDDRIMGDELAIDQRAAFADKNAGAAKQVNVSEIALSGVDAQNYFFAGSSLSRPAESIFTENIGPAPVTSTTTTANIFRKAVDIALTGSVSKIDNGDTVATLLPSNYLVTGVLSGDTLTVNKITGTYATSRPAQGVLVSVALNNADLSNNNYSVVNNSTIVSAPIGTIKPAVDKSISVSLTGTLKAPPPPRPPTAPNSVPPPPPPSADGRGTGGSAPPPPPENSGAGEPARKQAASNDPGESEGGSGDTEKADSTAPGNQGTETAKKDSSQASPPKRNQPVETASVDASAPAPAVQTTVVAPPGGADNTPVAQTPPSPVGNTKPATPVDVADAADGALSAAKNDSPPALASNAKRQVVGLTTVNVSGVPMQQTIQPSVPPAAVKEQRFSLTGNFQ